MDFSSGLANRFDLHGAVSGLLASFASVGSYRSNTFILWMLQGAIFNRRVLAHGQFLMQRFVAATCGKFYIDVIELA